MENTFIDRLPDFKVETLDTTVAEAETDVLVDGLTERLAAAKINTLAYTLANSKCKALVDTLAGSLAQV